VTPLAVGRVLVATQLPHEHAVLQAIRESGQELQVVFNKGAVMVLPAGINKAVGLAAALREMRLSPHNVVGVGDAENDHAFLCLCECSAAVAGAVGAVKAGVDLVTRGDDGAGVVELIEALIADDLRAYEGRLTRHHILLGHRADGGEVRLPSYGGNVLLAGTSGSGKSTLATAFLERLAERRYQFCIVDPEGHYQNFEGAVVLGDPKHAPTIAEILQILAYPEQHAVVNLLGLALEDRPGYFVALFSRLQELRVQTGRPHWLVVDEAHHLLPVSWNPARQLLTPHSTGLLLIAVHPDQVAPAVLSSMHHVIAIGESPEQTLGAFARALGQAPPHMPSAPLPSGEALLWERHGPVEPQRFRLALGRVERARHRRKYAQGELGADKSFYYRGPEGRLNLRAQNLMLFMQLSEGVDDATWLYHLRRGDYSRWFREAIKDEGLAAEAAEIERRWDELTPAQSRQQVKAAIARRYTLPASAPASVPGDAPLASTAPG
jgi:energy-coupling factor transporter ATP-binding protein EcfA2